MHPPGEESPQPASKRCHVIEPVGRLRSSTSRRFSHKRKPDLLGKPQRFRRVGDELVSGARHPGRAKHRFHPGLVAYVESGLHVHAVKAEQLTCVRHGHLQLLECTDEALDGAHLLA